MNFYKLWKLIAQQMNLSLIYLSFAYGYMGWKYMLIYYIKNLVNNNLNFNRKTWLAERASYIIMSTWRDYHIVVRFTAWKQWVLLNFEMIGCNLYLPSELFNSWVWSCWSRKYFQATKNSSLLYSYWPLSVINSNTSNEIWTNYETESYKTKEKYSVELPPSFSWFVYLIPRVLVSRGATL